MVMIKMAPTDTTTLHIEYSHANHIMAEGLSVSRGSDKLDKIICPAELSVRSVSVSALKTHAHTLLFLRPDQDLNVHVCVSECVQ